MTTAATAPATAPTTAAPAAASQHVPTNGERLQRIAVALIDRLAAAAVDKVDELADRLQDFAQNPGGIGMTAMVQAGLAKMQGKNPVWAAIKGAVSAMSTTTKILLGLLLILVAVLSPVAILVLAIVLIIAGIVGAVSG
ncbi:hypothetical protein EV188_105246 [Actinomycetospora succinea]|uniref:Uncharacterized protein n=1 Tax=Actinomycetospora succinea TaxID=663603 RepID=A0A4R6VAA1_9PSEU|nr:hypothetical protein [Actinomycetospora succinea]TDQ55848.1 hypothetical protein EV188_105246 [Actinomycetospora succinea]